MLHFLATITIGLSVLILLTSALNLQGANALFGLMGILVGFLTLHLEQAQERLKRIENRLRKLTPPRSSQTPPEQWGVADVTLSPAPTAFEFPAADEAGEVTDDATDDAADESPSWNSAADDVPEEWPSALPESALDLPFHMPPDRPADGPLDEENTPFEGEDGEPPRDEADGSDRT